MVSKLLPLVEVKVGATLTLVRDVWASSGEMSAYKSFSGSYLCLLWPSYCDLLIRPILVSCFVSLCGSQICTVHLDFWTYTLVELQ